MNTNSKQTKYFMQNSKGHTATASHDTELLEKSLLRSLATLLNLTSTAVYKTDVNGGLLRARLFQRYTEGDNSSRTAESFNAKADLSDVMPELHTLTEKISQTCKPCTLAIGNEWLIGYPLFSFCEPWGCVVFQSVRQLDPAEEASIVALTSLFANFLLMLDDTQRDRLTGFLNREQMWTALSRPDFLVVKQDSDRRSVAVAPNWLAVIDIDQFKELCEQRGQLIADEIVHIVSNIMTLTFRSSDLLYRSRGEEFVAIISAENKSVARNVFERLRSSVEEHTFPHAELISLSIGYCRADPDVLPLEVLSRADRSLHQARLDGMNRCYEFDDLYKSGILMEE